MVQIRTAGDSPALSAIDAAPWSAAATPGPAPDPGRAFFGERQRPGDVLVATVDGDRQLVDDVLMAWHAEPSFAPSVREQT